MLIFRGVVSEFQGWFHPIWWTDQPTGPGANLSVKSPTSIFGHGTQSLIYRGNHPLQELDQPCWGASLFWWNRGSWETVETPKTRFSPKEAIRKTSGWWLVSNISLFSPRTLGKIPVLTSIFQMAWNHQPASFWWRFITTVNGRK